MDVSGFYVKAIALWPMCNCSDGKTGKSGQWIVGGGQWAVGDEMSVKITTGQASRLSGT